MPPFDSTTALAIIQANLGAPADMVFAEFDPNPIAAASLGQVHLARLETGEQVVVKVRTAAGLACGDRFCWAL